MSSKGLTMKSTNKGVTARINMWALARYMDHFDAEKARLWMKGEITNAETGRRVKFNDAGELISTLGRWNRDKLRQLKARTR